MNDQTKDSIELLPCPFCGDTTIMTDDYGSTHGAPKWTIWCNECGATQHDRCWSTEAEAIAAWNRRALPQPRATAQEAVAYSPSQKSVMVACDWLDKIRDSHAHWGGWSGIPNACEKAVHVLRYGAPPPQPAPETAAQASEALHRAFESGWRVAADWAERPDLHSDIGSPAYEHERDVCTANLAAPVVPEGLRTEQEPKYTTRAGKIVNRASGEAIPDDEPVFVFRARDRKALLALQTYAAHCYDPIHVSCVNQRIEDFRRFADVHHDRLKEPDTAAPRSTETGR